MSFIENMNNKNDNENSKNKNNNDILDNLEKNNIILNEDMNNSNNQINRRKSSHSSIVCIDNNQNKKINNIESNKITEENIFKDSNIVSSLKNKIIFFDLI